MMMMVVVLGGDDGDGDGAAHADVLLAPQRSPICIPNVHPHKRHPVSVCVCMYIGQDKRAVTVIIPSFLLLVARLPVLEQS